MKPITIIKRNIDALGDTIMMSIIADTYQYHFPNHEIHLHLDSNKEYQRIFLNNYIDNIQEYKYSNSILLDGMTFGCVSIVNCDLSSESSVYEDSGIYIDRIELSLLKLNCATDFVIKKKPNVQSNIKCSFDVFVHCDSNDEKRQYKHWSKVIDSLFAKGLNIAYSFGNRCYFKTQNHFGKGSDFSSYSEGIKLDDLITIIASSKIFLGNDSGLMHVAALYDIPSLCLFGSTIPKTRLKYYPNTKYILSDVECVGCYNKPCYNKNICMSSITYEDIISKIEKEFNEILF